MYVVCCEQVMFGVCSGILIIQLHRKDNEQNVRIMM